MQKIPLLENIEKYLLDPLILLMFGLALFLFMWGLVEYLLKGASAGESDRKKAQDNILWGVVGMTIMVSVYGIMHVITNTICQLAGC